MDLIINLNEMVYMAMFLQYAVEIPTTAYEYLYYKLYEIAIGDYNYGN